MKVVYRGKKQVPQFVLWALMCVDIFSLKPWAEHQMLSQRKNTIAVTSHITDAGKPTYIFLPGIFRGAHPDKSDVFLQQLSSEGRNWVALDFSTHPGSVVRSSKESQQTGAGHLREMTLEELSAEVHHVIEALAIKQPLVVSLSYSSSVASKILPDKTAVIIETAPMVRQEDTKGFLREVLENNNRICAGIFMAMTPFCQSWFYQKEIAYKTYWTTVATSQKKTYKELEDGTVFERVVEGYVSMAKAVETFDLRSIDFKKGPRRVFILGEKEDVGRLQLQNEVVKSYAEQTGEMPYVFIVKDAGHIVPFDQPKAYNTLLALIAQNKLPKNHRVFMVDTDGNLEAQ